MRIVGPIEFWRGCVIYLYKKKIIKKITPPPLPPLPRQGAFRGGGHPEHIPVFRALLETTDPYQKADSVNAKIWTWSTLEHIFVFRVLFEHTDPHQKTDWVHAKMRTRSMLGGKAIQTTSLFLGLYSRPPIRTKKRTRSTQKCGLGPR